VPSRVSIPRQATERLRELRRIRELADAEAAGILAGLGLALGFDPAQLAGVEDGDEPAVLLEDSSGESVENA
jgi:hypothetical protein